MKKKDKKGRVEVVTPRSTLVRSGLFFQFAEVLNAQDPEHEFDELCELGEDVLCIPIADDRPAWVDQQFSERELALVEEMQKFLESLPTPWVMGSAASNRMRTCLLDFGVRFTVLATEAKASNSP